MDIQQIDETTYRLPIPVPFPMKYVYCYLFKEPSGWTIVDTGVNYPPAKEAWEEAFAELGVAAGSVQRIYLTHFHPDHFGLAGWLQEKTDAAVYISEEDFHMSRRVWGKDSRQAEHIAVMCKQNGVPDELTEQIKQQMEKLQKNVAPLPNLTVLKEAHVILGGVSWEVIKTPGHSDGLICFFQPEKQLLLAADHVLDKITPNVSLWPGASRNPLQDYLRSLDKVCALNVNKALPAHGGLIADLSGRVEEIMAHHEERLKNMFQLSHDGKTAYEVASEVFRHKELNAHQWRFAMAETLAHLEFLVSRGELTRQEGTVIQYTAASPVSS
ncbi:MBL fold metallo-hydrolase [Bacillus thermotolerans]|uniref:Metallo-beta-lactamase domain-containing protein n=1 Tax=Bacillus thermotolerans TaxID=1221996 RepID=A0A0F5HTS2_BACTR|nr:MBL fold metallo-hydrolase [Bacillus thermotolerans]KKB36638.1 hypothetical protein QY97_00810 [Bacillus thermotolerans]KKB40610.1 hypothetical protein QY95_01184 [Bacillus thermotolerans]KKB41271.1 hypothetical protein QY96_02073 [Bacillus thermotolerans]